MCDRYIYVKSDESNRVLFQKSNGTFQSAFKGTIIFGRQLESCTGGLLRLVEDKIESEQRTLHIFGYLWRKHCKRRGPTFAATF